MVARGTQALYNYVGSLEHVKLRPFRLQMNMPRRVFQDRTQTLADAGLVPNAALVVDEDAASDAA